MWLDLDPLEPDGSGPLSQPRRWFADPLTRMLLAQWHATGAAPVEQNAEECLSLFFNWAGHSSELADLLVKHAERHWQFRMPKLLLAHAAGKHRAVPVSGEDWRRVLGCEFDAGELSRQANDRGSGQSTERWCTQQKRILRRAKDAIRRRPTATLEAKRKAVDELSALRPSLPGERLMTSWCMEALTLSTAASSSAGSCRVRWTGICNLLSEHIVGPSDDLVEMSADDLIDRFDGRIAVIEKPGCRTRALNALRSLYHHLRRHRPDLPSFPLLLEAHATEQRASANLVTPSEFARALDQCRNAISKSAFSWVSAAGYAWVRFWGSAHTTSSSTTQLSS